jgi:hypothetical protein
VTAYIRKFAARVRNIADWCGLSAEDLTELDVMCANARSLCDDLGSDLYLQRVIIIAAPRKQESSSSGETRLPLSRE